jgi:hypothetical protein
LFHRVRRAEGAVATSFVSIGVTGRRGIDAGARCNSVATRLGQHTPAAQKCQFGTQLKQPC